VSALLQASRLPTPVRITEQVWPEATVPVVSIRCITYNHVNFIRDAIQGFLMQETTFPVEILIHDDASTDGTADIIREYQRKHPQLVRTVLQEENQLSKGRRPGIFLAPMTRGAFVALCEGDDYWTDPLKLQRQVSALLAAPTASGSFHAVSMVNEEGDELEVRPPQPVPHRLTFSDVVIRNHLLTCSLVYRSSSAPATSPWSAHLPMGDWPLQVNLTRSGDLLGIEGNMGRYRRHRGGVWTRRSKTDELKAISAFYAAVEKAFDSELPQQFHRRCKEHREECLFHALTERHYLEVLKRLPDYFRSRLACMLGAPGLS
jgi:glycosyltransferase involved in cell wall biosynthesis